MRPSSPTIKMEEARGTAYEDPTAFLRFLSYTNEKEVLSKEISKIIEPKTAKEILDVGGGDGSLIKLIAPKDSRVTFIEPAHEMLARARENLLGRNVNFIEGKFETSVVRGDFDLILLSHVIHNFPNWESALNRALQLKKKGGKVIIITHDDASEYLKMVKAFWPQLHGEPYERRSNGQILETLKEIGQKPKAHSAESGLSIPDVEEAIRMSGFLFYKSYAELNESQKNLLRHFFNSKLIEGRGVVIKLKHFIVEV